MHAAALFCGVDIPTNRTEAPFLNVLQFREDQAAVSASAFSSALARRQPRLAGDNLWSLCSGQAPCRPPNCPRRLEQNVCRDVLRWSKKTCARGAMDDAAPLAYHRQDRLLNRPLLPGTGRPPFDQWPKACRLELAQA
jgi:hypothetical protein